MCWSAAGSLNTWAFAMTLIAIHYFRGRTDPVLLLFLATFTQIQLVEYFLWKNLNNVQANAFWSRVGFLVLILETLVAAALLPAALRAKAWAVILGVTAVYLLTHKIDARTTIGDNGHLKWHWAAPVNSPWGMGWIAMILAPFFIMGYNSLALFGVFTALVSMYFNYKYETFGSYWCWIAVSGALIPFLK